MNTIPLKKKAQKTQMKKSSFALWFRKQRDVTCDGAIELCLPIAQELKIEKLRVILEQGLEQIAHFDLSVNVENNHHHGKQDDDHVQNVP